MNNKLILFLFLVISNVSTGLCSELCAGPTETIAVTKLDSFFVQSRDLSTQRKCVVAAVRYTPEISNLNLNALRPDNSVSNIRAYVDGARVNVDTVGASLGETIENLKARNIVSCQLRVIYNIGYAQQRTTTGDNIQAHNENFIGMCLINMKN